MHKYEQIEQHKEVKQEFVLNVHLQKTIEPIDHNNEKKLLMIEVLINVVDAILLENQKVNKINPME